MEVAHSTSLDLFAENLAMWPHLLVQKWKKVFIQGGKVPNKKLQIILLSRRIKLGIGGPVTIFATVAQWHFLFCGTAIIGYYIVKCMLAPSDHIPPWAAALRDLNKKFRL